MKIGDIDIDKKVLVVAEVGNNHAGNFALAKKMIYEAAEAGADAVKFQTFRAEEYVTIEEKKRYDQLKGFEFSYKQFEKLASIADKNGLLFLSTPFDLRSVDELDPFILAFKISSGDNTFWPLIKRVASKRKPVILSTGIATEEELKGALNILKEYGRPESIKEWVGLLHCVSCYPVPHDELNLLSIKYLRDIFGLTVGYSDHTPGITACLAAVALGARIIEKHFTYDKKNQTLRDHLLSAKPREFKEMVKEIRLIETSLGEYKKESMPCEEKLKAIVRRSIAANKLIKKGRMIESDDLTWVRPAFGLPIEQEKVIVGKRAVRDIQKGQLIRKEDIE